MSELHFVYLVSFVLNVFFVKLSIAYFFVKCNRETGFVPVCQYTVARRKKRDPENVAAGEDEREAGFLLRGQLPVDEQLF